jgi:hypothetical protein
MKPALAKIFLETLQRDTGLRPVLTVLELANEVVANSNDAIMGRRPMSRLSYIKSWAVVCCLPVLFAIPTISLADQPATTTATTEHLTAKVTAIENQVQYRASEDDGWKECVVGLELGEGAAFRTGLNSSVTIVIPPKQTIKLDRLGFMTLLEAVQHKGKYTTGMGMEYGRLRDSIEEAGVEHEAIVRTPNSTMAVRDTNFAVDDERPFPPEAYRLSGTVDFSTARRTISLGGAIPGNVKAVGDQNTADTSLAAAVVDPSLALARTPAEQTLVASVLSRGAVFSLNSPKQIPIVSGGSPPSQDEIIKTLAGHLSFVLTWDGNANLDLRVDSQKSNEVLYPQVPLNRTLSGGFIPFNDIGGPLGGVEYAYWKGSFPIGNYQIAVYDLSGVPVNFNAQVFLYGKPLPFLFTDFSDLAQSATFTGPIKAGQVLFATLPVGGGLPPSGLQSPNQLQPVTVKGKAVPPVPIAVPSSAVSPAPPVRSHR